MELTEKYKRIKILLDQLAETKKKKDKGETYFLLIGIDEYFKERNSRFCVDDSEILLGIFRRHFDTKLKNTYKLYNAEATKFNILSQVENLSKVVKPADRVIVYFSGHGFNNEYSNFFIPSDGKREIEISCIPNKYLFNAFTEYLCKSLLLIFDYSFDVAWNKAETYRSEINYIDGIYKKNKKEQNLYSDFLNFLKIQREHKVKESFLFIKTVDDSVKKIGTEDDQTIENILIKDNEMV